MGDTVEQKTPTKELLKRIADLEREGALKDTAIMRFRQTEQQLDWVYSSFSWRITAPLRRIGNWLCRRTGIFIAARHPTTVKEVEAYPEWIERYDTLSDSDRLAIADHVSRLSHTPLISVVLQVYNASEECLRLAIDSVIKQLYPFWELCIDDDALPAANIRQLIEEYRQSDSRIKVVFHPENRHIPHKSNSALDLACGEFVALLEHDDELAPHALYMMAVELEMHPAADIIYSDEDKVDEVGDRFQPIFKPDWNPDLFSPQNYIGHFTMYRRALVVKVGGYRKGFEENQDYDLCLRCVAATSSDKIRHIPRILYHWRAIKGSTTVAFSHKSYAEDAGVKALRDYFQQIDSRVEVKKGLNPTTYLVTYPVPTPPPLVSIIIPTRDCCKILKTCVSSIIKKTSYQNFELIIVDNQSTQPETARYFAELQRDSRIRILTFADSFNYSAINNFAVRYARGEIVCLCNNDLEVISPDWLTEMVRHAVRPEIGAVGAKLYYPDGRIQHGGVVLGIGGVAGHAYHGFPNDCLGHWGRLILPQSISAVTAACLMVRKEVYESVGGLDEQALAVAFNDIDFCLKLRAAGFRNFWTPLATLYHHESFTRGYEDTPEKRARFDKEIRCMQERWGELLFNDPYYNPNLTLESTDFSLACPPRVEKPWEMTN